jgi:hypothetical protein
MNIHYQNSSREDSTKAFGCCCFITGPQLTLLSDLYIHIDSWWRTVLKEKKKREAFREKEQ